MKKFVISAAIAAVTGLAALIAAVAHKKYMEHGGNEYADLWERAVNQSVLHSHGSLIFPNHKKAA